VAKSPAHRLGQIIGDVLEAAIDPLLREFAESNSLYLDTRGRRPARAGVKLTWTDSSLNSHDLDFVLERGGTPDEIGAPVAFIEAAWRRYTKHSRNKAQEIQGAIQPLAETFAQSNPFKGAILAGVFTEGALAQLNSLGFKVLFLPYSSVVDAFSAVGIDIDICETTADDVVAAKVAGWDNLSDARRDLVPSELLSRNSSAVSEFMVALRSSVSRRVSRISISVLHGQATEVEGVADAIAFVERHSQEGCLLPFVRYELVAHYSNGDRIEGGFSDRQSAQAFLMALPAAER